MRLQSRGWQSLGRACEVHDAHVLDGYTPHDGEVDSGQCGVLLQHPGTQSSLSEVSDEGDPSRAGHETSLHIPSTG